MLHLTTQDLCAISILLEDEEENMQNNYKRKYFSVHKILKKSKTEGEYWTLYTEVMDDEEKFFQYFRLSQYQFNELLQKIEVVISKRNSSFKEAITLKEILAVCLR